MLILGLFALTACQHASPTVAVIPRTTATLLWEPMHAGAAIVARQNGLHLYWNAPTHESDTEEQRSLVSRSIARRYLGIILSPDETLALRTVVEDAIDKHVSVVIVDDDLGLPPGPYLSYVLNDENAGAQQAVQQLVRLLHGHGSAAIMGINRGLGSALQRERSLEHILATEAPGIHIVTRRLGSLNVAHEQQVADEVLHGPEPVDAILALSAPATRGAYYAKIGGPPNSAVHIIGFDQDILPPVHSGEIDAVVVQNTMDIGRVALSNIAAQLRGESVSGVTLIAPMLLTKENMSSPDVLRLWSFAAYPWSQQ